MEEVFPEHVIRINPEDLSLPYIVDLGVIRHLASLDVHLDPLFVALWKHVLLVEIIRHRYKVDSVTKKGTVLSTLRERIGRDASKRAALDYLDEFGESFWCETDERVKEITTNFETKVKTVGGLELGIESLAKVSGRLEGGGNSTTTELQREYADRYQRLVNDTQLPRLNKMIAVLDDEILASDQNFTYVVIDDLDRDWVDERVANDLIRSLFKAVLDLQRVRHLKVVVALRTNIFDHLSFGSRAGGQEEKFRALQLRLKWTKAELRELADERVRVAAERTGLAGVLSVSDLLPEARKTTGNAFDYILDRTLMRPRDVIAYLNECVSNAAGQSRLSWNDLTGAEPAYSHNRLLALRDEWKQNYPGLDRVLNVFRGAPPSMTEDSLTEYLDNVALLAVDHGFDGVRWVTDLAEPLWSGGGAPQEWADSYQPLVKLLYDIGFLGVESGGHRRFAYDASGYADAPQNLSTGTRYVIHPAFQPALGVRKRAKN